MQSQGQLAVHVVIIKAIYVQICAAASSIWDLKKCVSWCLMAQICFSVAAREQCYTIHSP